MTELEKLYSAKECLEKLGSPVPKEVLDRIAELEALEKSKETSGTPIYFTFQKNSKFQYSDELKMCVTETVDALLEDHEDATQPCLLLGNIQCGKTNTFENIMALAMDKGIDICLVLTKGTTALAAQTAQRASVDFSAFKDMGKIDQTVIEIYDAIKMPFLTAAQIRNKNTKYIIVCKKETRNLENMIQMFRKDYMRDVKTLIVDDEADFASRNYKKVHSNMLGLQKEALSLAKISEQIDTLISIPNYCRYLQVTATPYSMLLQPDGTVELKDGYAFPFKPRFISEVPVHSAYIGGKQYYEESQNPDSMYSHIYHQTTDKAIVILQEKHASYIKNGVNSKNATDIVNFFVCYLMATAIRVLQEAKNGKSYHSSAIIHCTTQKNLMKWQSDLTNHYLFELKEVFSKGIACHKVINDYCEDLYNDFKESTDKGKNEGLLNSTHYFPSYADTVSEMTSILQDEEFKIQIVNSEESISAQLDDRGQLKISAHKANLFIGGFTLDRGVTIDHLLCTFYGRNPGAAQQNTVLQHARWYGSRSKEDMAVTRFYTSREIQDILVRVNDLDNQMRKWVRSMKEGSESGAYFIGVDKGIKPCSSQQILPSNTITLKGHKRILPVGFQTYGKTKLKEDGNIDRIDKLLHSQADYKEGEVFEIDMTLAAKIIDLIECTFDYTGSDSLGYSWNGGEMKAALLYGSEQSDGKVFCLHRTGRQMARKRTNGNFIDAPDDGRSDTAYSRSVAINQPVLMLLGQQGNKSEGWCDHPFYWPVVMMPQKIKPAIFTFGRKRNTDIDVKDASMLTNGIPNELILRLSITESEYDDVRNGIKIEDERLLDSELGASKFLVSGEGVNGKTLAEGVNVEDVQAGIFSYNYGKFPFQLRKYRFILYNTRRDNTGNRLLVEVNGCKVSKHKSLSENDTLEDASGNLTSYEDQNMAVWKIIYKISRIVGYYKVDTDEYRRVSLPEFEKNIDENISFFDKLDLSTEDKKKAAKEELSKIIEPLVAKYADIMDVYPGSIIYSATKSQWGRCTDKIHNLQFSLYLLLLPEWCIEHVVVHELAHIIEPNHSPAFYAVVDKYFSRRKEAMDETSRICGTQVDEEI